GVMLAASPHADSLGLTFAGADTIRGAGGAGGGIYIRTATASSIALAGHTIPDVRVEVLPGHVGMNASFEGVIGAELFQKYVVRIDADRRQVELFDPATGTPPQGSCSVPIRLRERKAFIEARVKVDWRPAITADLAVDLGATHSLWLNQRSGRFVPPNGTIRTTLGRGMSGEMRGHV